MKLLGSILLVLTAMGVIYGVFHGAFFGLARYGADGGWSWWQYLLAVPVIGVLGLLGEAIGEAIGNIIGAPVRYAWSRTPRWLQVSLAVAGPLLVIGGAFWLSGQGGNYDPTVMTEKH
jgi:hypothetical protein